MPKKKKFPVWGISSYTKKYLVNALSIQMLQKGGIVRFKEIDTIDMPADIALTVGHAAALERSIP